MPPDFHDRFLALVAGKERTPIRAEEPGVRGDGATAVLRLYDPVDSWGGTWGVSAKEFAAVLDELPDSTETIELHVNSPGGEAFEGIAILNLLRQHDARYVAVVDGVAASAASFIAAGAEELVMAPNSELFVHRAWGLVVGNAEDMTKFAGELDHLDRNLASIYAKKAGGTVDDWLAAMSEETWYSAEEAVAAGLADRVDDAAPDGNKAKATVDLSIFKNSGRKPAPGRQHGPKAEKGGSDMDPVKLRADLGLPEDATDEQVGERLTALASVEQRATTAEARVSELEGAHVPEGHVAVPEARLKDLEAAAQRGVNAAEKLHAKERNEFLDSVKAKFMPANRAAWEAEYDKNPEATREHFAKAPDIIPVNEIGTGADDLETEDDRFYADLYGKEAKV